MKRFSILNRSILLLVPILVFISCESSKDRASNSFMEFYNAYKNEDFEKIFTYYPNIGELSGNMWKTDEMIVKNVSFNKDTAIVVSENHWTNPFGKTSNREMTFFMVPDKNDKGKFYRIVDSKSFVAFDDNMLIFGRKVGAIDMMSDKTDIKISKKMDTVKKMFESAKNSLRNQINRDLIVSGFNWEASYYGNYGSGRAYVTNNSSFTVPKVQYKITYKKSKTGAVTAYDDGTATYSSLAPGQSVSFSWMTSNIGSASWAEANCFAYDYDDDWLDELLTQQPYTGREYSQYKELGLFVHPFTR